MQPMTSSLTSWQAVDQNSRQATILKSSVSGVGYLGEGNGTPLQYSCLENPMDGEAW